MSSLVSVIIPTCGSHEFFIACLDSLTKQTHKFLEVIVINNALDPRLSQKVLELFPSAKVISPMRNLYYGASMNEGIAVSSGSFVLCLNDDTVLERDFIERALTGFSVSEDIGMVSGKILRPDRKTIDTTGLFLSVWRTARERGYGRVDHGQYDMPGAIFGVSGVAALYRRKMLEQVKEERDYFDPTFRMFYEDLDLAWRAHKRGWRAYYVPDAVGYHVRGGSVRIPEGRGRSVARKYLSDELHAGLIKNRYRAILKNETFFGFFFYLLPIILYDLCAWLHVIFFKPKVVRLFFSDLKFVLRRRIGKS